MTDLEQKTQKTEVQRVGKYLTVQNAVQLLVIIGFISGFYFKTSYRLDATEKNQQSTAKILQYQTDWLTKLSIKTGEPPPARRDDP